MAQDFIAKVTAELDTATAEGKLNEFLNREHKLKIDVEVNQDSAKKLASSIENGIKSTKIDTSSISKRLADSFNISDKDVIRKLQSQINSMVSSLGKTWNGKDFDFRNAKGFYSGMDDIAKTITQNAKVVQSATGVYDDFYKYFKDKKIYVSDDLKKALGGDTYKELLKNNIGNIVKDASKGMNIDSLWSEMSSLFPEHFSKDISNQADQLIHTFDLVRKAREDMVKTLSYSDLDSQQRLGLSDDIYGQAFSTAENLADKLKKNILAATEAGKTTIDLDVNVNSDKIMSDIRKAVQSAGNLADEPLNIDIKANEDQLVSGLRSTLGKLSSGDEPVKVDIQINKESLQSDLNAALEGIDLPIHFKVDADALVGDIRAAVDSITDIEIDLKVNRDSIKSDISQAVKSEDDIIHIAQADTSGLSQLQQIMNNVNAAGRQGQSVFQSFGGSLREAFSTFTMANLLEDAIYKVGDAAKQGIDTVKEFNDIKTSLAMATGEEKSYIDGLMESYNDLGQELGTITSDVAESADSWLRQGRSLSETNQLIKESLVLSKDTNISSEQSSEILTATLNGFQLAADQAGHINDVLTSIDLESASDAGGIGEALTKVASMANNAGVSLEKTAAMIATIKDVTQASDRTIGTALKSIFSRMNQIKAGKFVDAETGEPLNDVEKVLDKVGISMRDVNGQFRDTESIMDDVASRWNSFDSMTQKAIATAQAGAYQYNNLIALYDNYDKVRRLTETAQNSEGTAEQKFTDNYLTSLEAKTNALKASLESLSTSVLSEDMYAGFLDGAKAVTDFVNQTDLLQASLAGLGTVGAGFAFSWIGDVIQGFSDLGSAMDILKSGDMTDDVFESLLNLTDGLSESQTRLILSSTALTDAQRAAILMNQGMSQAQAQATVASMGLAAAEGTATASTVSLSSALSGLWATLMANPLILVAAGVTAAVAAFSAFNNAAKEAVSSAKESMGEWDENNASIQENIDKITQLRTELASGTLSEQEAAQAKSELLSIQESLTESYGNQVEGIDLLNGSLEQQISLLDQVSQKEAQRSLNENREGIEKAQKEMEKDRYTFLGQFADDGSEQSKAIRKSIEKLQEQYGEEVFQLSEGMEGTASYKIDFNADASTAKEALNDFMSEMDSIQDQYGESELVNSMINRAYGGLEESKGILEEYQDLYEQAAEAELIADEKLFQSGDREQTAAKWLSDYAKAIEEYNNALSEGDDTKITEAAAQFHEIDNAINSMAQNTGMSEYTDQISEVREQLNDTAIAAYDFQKAIEGQDTSDFGKSVSESVKALKELGMSDTDFKYAFETEGVQEGEDAVQSLVNAALECGVISDTSSEQVNGLVSMLSQLGVISATAAAGVDTVSEAAQDLSDNISQSKDILASITAATSLITAQSTGKSISIDDFNSEELEDYTSALEYNNGTLQLNAEKVRELQKAKAEEAIQTNDNLKLEKQSQYMDNIREIERYQEELRNLTDAKGEHAQAIQDSIDALLTENDGIVNQCAQLDLLSASLREATGAYQNWLDKQNASESGDMFDDALGAMQHIDEVTQDTDSEYYGRIGRESYKAAVEFIVPDSVDTDNAKAVQSYIDSIEHYFMHDEDGKRIGMDVTEFCQDAVDQGLMTIDEASGQYQIAGQRTMEDFANGLNMSMPMVQAMFGEMEEFGGEFSWADEGIKTLGDLGMAAGEAKARIEEISGNEGLDIQIDVSDIDTTEGKIAVLDNTISQMQNYKSTLEVDSSQIEDANTIIQYCITQKQMLSKPVIMSVDTSQVSGEIGNVISLLQQFQTAQDNLELQAAIGADTSEAQAEVDGLVGQIQGLTPEIHAKLGIDPTSAATIDASIQGITSEILVKAGVDSAEVDAYIAEEKESSGTVTWDNNTGAVDSYAATMKSSNGTVVWSNDTSLVRTEFSATGTVNWINANPPSGTHSVNGTAHAAGTAHYPHLVGHANARGNWGTKTGGMTLVGELGREIVVDPNTGTWHTVGDNGAEFTNIPKGSIVFNHLQTEALLERGFVAGRGKAQASGSAMVTGGISILQAQIASGLATYSGSSSSTSSNTAAQSANTAATQANTEATEENAEAAEKSTSMLDWVQRRLTWFSDQVKAIGDAINDFISPIQKTALLAKQVDAVNAEMKANYAGARTYYEKAQSLGLDIKTRKLVEEGKYNLEEIDTSTDEGQARYDLINEYQDYYDKYRDCIDAVRELRNEQVELFKQWADMPTETAEKKIEQLEQSFNGLTAIEARISAADLGESTQAALVKQLNALKTSTENSFESARQNLVSAKTKENAAAKTSEADKKALQTATNQLKNRVSLTATERSRLSSGQALSTKGLTGRKKTLVVRYNNALKKSNASQSNYNTIHQEANEARKTYTAAKTAMTEYKKQYDTAMKYYNAGDSLSYQNYLVDAQLSNQKQQNDAYQQAYQQAMKNTQTATTKKTTAANTLTNVKNRGKNYAQRYAKYLTATQRKQLANGQKVSLSGIKNKNLYNAFNKYNIDLQNAMNSYTAATQQLTAAQESEAEAAANAAESQAEYAQAQIEAEQKKLENISNYYDKRIEYQNALAEVQEQERELSEAHGNYTKSTDYDSQIKAAQEAQKLQQEAAKKMQEQLDKSVKSGVIKQNSQEWMEMKTQILDAENAARDYNTQIENLKQEQIITQYAEMFDRVIDKSDQFIDKLETINQLISDAMMFDYDTGYLTEFGALAIILNAKELDSSLDMLANYVKKRQQIIDDYNKGKFGQEKYDELIKENDASLQSVLQSADSYRQAIIQIIKDQAEAEQEALFKVIDARKEALKKKKEYYDYDKQLKSQTKEINLLEQQIAALDGVTDAESRAQKARLEAQLKEQQDELDDTVRDHVYDLQVNGLDELQDQLSEDFDRWANELSANIDKMSEAINDAVNNVSGNTSDALNTIAEILKQFGINPSQVGITASDLDTSDMKHYAKGTNKVQHKEVALTNEEGRELILTKDGLITTLYPGDSVLNNKVTEGLIRMAQSASMSENTKNIQIPSPEVIVKNQTPSFNVNYGGFVVQGDLTRDTLPNLQTIMQKTCDYTRKEITRDLRMSR